MRNRIKYSQNFLKSTGLIRDLLRNSSIGQDDVVYEIGAGQGIITQELSKVCKKVVAFEIDKNLSNKLQNKFRNSTTLEIRNQNFLLSEIPHFEYKVFSNIPFNLTAEIVKKLVFSDNPPTDSYLILQKEAAKKFLGSIMGVKNSLISVLIQVNFELSLFHEFSKEDFIPRPMVDIVMVKILKRENTLLSSSDKGFFYDFVTFGFSQFEPNISKGLGKIMPVQVISEVARQKRFSVSVKPSEVPVAGWIALFDSFMRQGNKTKVVGSYKKLLSEQARLEKSHRTRVDKNWKTYRSN